MVKKTSRNEESQAKLYAAAERARNAFVAGDRAHTLSLIAKLEALMFEEGCFDHEFDALEKLKKAIDRELPT